MPKPSKKFGVKFDGFADMAADYDKLGGDLKEIVTECLKFIPQEINPTLHQIMQKYRRTGRTEASIVDNQPVEWEGTKATIEVGFDLSNGGLPSIFLMYGTPRHPVKNQYGTPKRPGAKTEAKGVTQDKQLFDAIFGSKVNQKIADRQAAIFAAALEKKKGGG